MSNQVPSNRTERKGMHILVGALVMIAGFIILALMQRSVSSNYPWLHQLWPLIFLAGVLSVFIFVRNPIISSISGILALLAVFAYIADLSLLRMVLGIGCIGFGLLVLYHLVAELILAKQNPH